MATATRAKDHAAAHAERRQMSIRVVLTLDGEEQATIAVLKALLKRLLRSYGVRCTELRSLKTESGGDDGRERVA